MVNAQLTRRATHAEDMPLRPTYGIYPGYRIEVEVPGAYVPGAKQLAFACGLCKVIVIGGLVIVLAVVLAVTPNDHAPT